LARLNAIRVPEKNQTSVITTRSVSRLAFAAKAAAWSRAFGLAVGWTVLALYLVIYSSAGLGLAALMGSFDEHHQIQVRPGKSGLALVLHHGHSCDGHRHGLIAHTLTWFAQPPSPSDPDHVIQFGAADTSSSNAKLALPSPQGTERPAAVVTAIDWFSFSLIAQRLANSHPPPDRCETVRSLRSTVLLI